MIRIDLKIDGIPAILWGEPSNKIFIAIHGNMSSKDDDVLVIFAEEAIEKGYQVLSFDLPEHGDRIGEDYTCKVWISPNPSLTMCSIFFAPLFMFKSKSGKHSSGQNCLNPICIVCKFIRNLNR